MYTYILSTYNYKKLPMYKISDIYLIGYSNDTFIKESYEETRLIIKYKFNY